MSKQRLIKRLEWYYPAEKMHAFLTFPAIIAYLLFFNSLRDILFLIYGLLVCIYILYQGQKYWMLVLHKLKGKEIEQKKNLDFFRSSKKWNVVLIALMPVVLFLQNYVSGNQLGKVNLIGWAIFANLFAIIEHINYYHRQISVDNKYDLNYVIRNRKLKVASLAK